MSLQTRTLLATSDLRFSLNTTSNVHCHRSEISMLCLYFLGHDCLPLGAPSFHLILPQDSSFWVVATLDFTSERSDHFLIMGLLLGSSVAALEETFHCCGLLLGSSTWLSQAYNQPQPLQWI